MPRLEVRLGTVVILSRKAELHFRYCTHVSLNRYLYSNSVSIVKEVFLCPDKTSFYAEAGGQFGDRVHLVTEGEAVHQVLYARADKYGGTRKCHLTLLLRRELQTLE